ncbi:DUF2157 domain-containing protein [Leptospira fluminis]|uniref:DUF2157 domain-containing protein n=1 Tax=Leptospira fluminis TaxID=2484979 RepID=A0A4R9GS21_9LEPT|nr:DUF2157 domain-containing protein [Leptospira fluminis]TGK21002.1 DUF2157 domain-containing protein [Leptospira fluminis]
MKDLEKGEIYEAIQTLDLGKDQIRKFLISLFPEREPKEWVRFASISFLGLGLALFSSGVVFFFAYNWAGMHRFSKLGLISCSLAAAVGSYLLGKSESYSKQALLILASVLVGVLLAVYGQIYQTGANAVDLFLGWTFLSLGFVVAGNSPPLWFLWILLSNITIELYQRQIFFRDESPYSYSFALLFNAAAVVLYEKENQKNDSKEIAGWFPNTVGFLTYYYATFGSIFSIFRDVKGEGDLLMVCLSLATLSVGYFVYRYKIKRLGILALSLLSAITLVFSVFVRIFDWKDFALPFLFGGIALTAATAWSARHLLRIRNEWKKGEREG